MASSQLGYAGYTSYSGRYGSSNGSIWMDDVQCSSSDNNLMKRDGDKVLIRLTDCNKEVPSFRLALVYTGDLTTVITAKTSGLSALQQVVRCFAYVC